MATQVPDIIEPTPHHLMEDKMETITTLKALTDYFNQGDGKRPMKAWADEIKALTPEEKLELATGAAEALGKTLV